MVVPACCSPTRSVIAGSALVSALLGDGPVLILCPATLTTQWQLQLKDKLNIPSAGVEAFVQVWPGLPGRPPCDRAALARAFYESESRSGGDRPMTPHPPRKLLRCAIYTRKSTEGAPGRTSSSSTMRAEPAPAFDQRIQICHGAGLRIRDAADGFPATINFGAGLGTGPAFTST
jgi:hypothetical protein